MKDEEARVAWTMAVQPAARGGVPQGERRVNIGAATEGIMLDISGDGRGMYVIIPPDAADTLASGLRACAAEVRRKQEET